MFGLDDHIATFSQGGSILIVLLVAILLGLRHATDPDHLARSDDPHGLRARARPASRSGAGRLVGGPVTR